ncbi:MAG: NAD-dependent epimerase/dehydratase family protein [Dokdonella sp.]
MPDRLASIALVVGASGAIGRFLLPRLLEGGYEVIALSRVPRASDDPRVRWIVGDLHSGIAQLPAFDVLYSLGPLDAFARWLSRASFAGAPRIIAFGSMSIETKRDSTDAHERALAARLQQAEQQLIAAADARGSRWTLFRPTLIYGAGIDRSLTPIARFALRWRVFPLLRGARGLRQPVHAQDLAAACVAVLDRGQTCGKTYALGGGERLAFTAMLARLQVSLPVRSLSLPIPLGVVYALLRIGHRLGLRSRHAGAVERLDRDLVADDTMARNDFDWTPRSFHPDARAWAAAEDPSA